MYGVCGIEKKIFLATGHRACGHRACSDPSYKKCRQNTPKIIFPTDLTISSTFDFFVHYTGLRRFWLYMQKSRFLTMFECQYLRK
jgi:hypothetical protein